MTVSGRWVLSLGLAVLLTGAGSSLGLTAVISWFGGPWLSLLGVTASSAAVGALFTTLVFGPGINRAREDGWGFPVLLALGLMAFAVCGCAGLLVLALQTSSNDLAYFAGPWVVGQSLGGLLHWPLFLALESRQRPGWSALVAPFPVATLVTFVGASLAVSG